MPIDYRQYPPNWRTEIRPRIMARAGEVRDDEGNVAQPACCEWCGIENYTQNARGSRVVLTIAHLDHDVPNHDVKDERLAALCQACHLGYDRPRNIEKQRFGRNWEKTQLKLEL